jgi:hypothetical protein
MDDPIPTRILDSEDQKCAEAADMTIINDISIAEEFNI